MGCRQGVAEEANAAASAVSDILLLTTMCIVGLPVDVHVKDGSIYSGVFHTASVEDNNYAIVLKKAMMIKKGNRDSNVTRGNVIETLMILSEDLAQVVAKGIKLPPDHITGYVKGDDGGAVVDDIHSEKDVEPSKPNESDRKRTQESKNTELTENKESSVVHKGQTVFKSQPKAEHTIENNPSAATPPSSVPKDDKSSKVCHNSSNVHPVSNKPAKESKLNPGAKIFCPRAVNPPPMPPVAYLPDCCHMVPGFATSEPTKLFQCNTNFDLQYVQPTFGYMGNRTLGPLVYVHPFPQVRHSENLDIVRNGVTQTLPLCVAPPYQAYTMPSQVPLSHPPLPVIRPLSNGYFSPKYT